MINMKVHLKHHNKQYFKSCFSSYVWQFTYHAQKQLIVVNTDINIGFVHLCTNIHTGI